MSNRRPFSHAVPHATLVAASLLAVASSVRAQDWPSWRGADDSGVSRDANLPATWSDTENIAWQTTLRGLGVSTPVVSGNRVFVTSQEGEAAERQGNHPTLVRGDDATGARERGLGGQATGARGGADEQLRFVVTALDRDTGARVWEYAFNSEGVVPEVHEKHNLASPSPVTDGQRVYAWFGTGQLVALDMNGKPVWRRHLGEEYAPVSIVWGPGSSPTLHEDSLLLLCYHGRTAYLLSVNAVTGETRWKYDHAPGVTSYSTPVVADGPAGPEIIVNSSVGVAGHSPATGERLWFYPEENSFPIPAAVPAGDGVVYLNRGYRSSPYMAIRLGGRGDITNTHVLWRQPTSGPYVPSVIQYDGLVYMATDQGIVSAVDAKTGERVWQQRIPGVYMASPVAGDGKIYFVGETGDTLVLQAGRTPKVLATNTLTGRFGASPAIAGGRLFLRADDRIVAIGNSR